MRAIQIAAPGRAVLGEVERPVAGPGEVLVRVLRVGLCPTDRRLTATAPRPGLIPGHEIGGVLPDGTAVGVHPDVGCGNCKECQAGFENRCPSRRSIGVDRDGGMAEWVAVPQAHVVPLDGVDAQLAPLLEPLACCLHALALLEAQPGDCALVVGAGPMGLLHVLLLRSMGIPVVVSQRSPERRRLALELGADAVVGAGEDARAVLSGVPTMAIVTAPEGEAVRYAMESVDVGGRVHVFAGLRGDPTVDGNTIHYRHLRVIGSTGSRLSDYQAARALAAERRVDLSRLPLRWVPFELLAELLSRPAREAARTVADLERSDGA
ncbi:MAG TPA: alcohol dehydrogenase catalytic domain-containing protein [Candidatus Limnocylindria bacterium]|nr:alcohol dehydrogenase catalytic domain-containing protein [Candidatus Limnocylindria bacterium]